MNCKLVNLTLCLCLSVLVSACDPYVLVAKQYQTPYMVQFSSQGLLDEFEKISVAVETFARIDSEKTDRHCKTSYAGTTKTIDCGRRTVQISKQGANAEIKIITTVYLPREKIEKDAEEKFAAELLRYVNSHTGVKF